MDLLFYLLMLNLPEAPCAPDEDAPSEAANDDEEAAEEPVPSPPGRGKG